MGHPPPPGFTWQGVCSQGPAGLAPSPSFAPRCLRIMALRVREFFAQQPLGGPCGPYPWRVTGDPPRRGVPLAYAVVGTALPPEVILDEVDAWQHLHLTVGDGPGLEDPAGEVWI